MVHKLLFVGDVVLQQKPEFSAPVAALFSESILKSCNFEAPVKGVGHAIPKTGPHVSQSENSITWLKELGFNLFALANNHINDFGAEAIDHTMKMLADQNLLGVGNEDEAYGLHIQTIDGVKYGFVAYGENGYGALNGDRSYGHAWINAPRVNNDISSYKKKVDVLIVQIHAGVEMLDVPIPEWRDRYRQIADCGADFIIAHHPHILQGYEQYQDTHIFYSLGNFAFDYPAHHPEWNRGGILQLIFENGKFMNFQLSIINKNHQTIELENEAQASEIFSTLNKKLFGDDYHSYVDQQAVKLWHTAYKNYYAKPFNGISAFTLKNFLKHLKRLVFNQTVDYDMLWHNMHIESNDWIVKRAIQSILIQKSKGLK